MTVTEEAKTTTHFLLTFASRDPEVTKTMVAERFGQMFPDQQLDFSVLYTSPKMVHPKDVNLHGVWDRMTTQEKEIIRGAHPELWLAIELLTGGSEG